MEARTSKSAFGKANSSPHRDAALLDGPPKWEATGRVHKITYTFNHTNNLRCKSSKLIADKTMLIKISFAFISAPVLASASTAFAESYRQNSAPLPQDEQIRLPPAKGKPW
jgi:hypothetical protein